MSFLRIDNISKSFYGVKAVDSISFEVDRGQIYSVIGPNGAGKTTLFNLITGIYTPDNGSVYLDNEPISQLATHELALKGISRTFQNLQIFMNMSAIENVMVGAHIHLDKNIIKSCFNLKSIRERDNELMDASADIMETVGLGSYIKYSADTLSYGNLKLLEVARSLATKPKLIFLDEPAAGLNPQETESLTDLIFKIRDMGITVVIVEHDMKLVMSISEKILVMNYGKKLAEGNSLEIRNNPDVISAYLGKAKND